MAKLQYNRIKGALAEAGVTSKELAEGIDKSLNQVSRYVTNAMQPSIPVLYDIGAFLGVDPRELLLPPKSLSSSSKKK